MAKSKPAAPELVAPYEIKRMLILTNSRTELGASILGLLMLMTNE